MAKTIWEFPLEVTDYQQVDVPSGADVISAQLQGVVLCAWAIVDPESPPKPRGFAVVGTGHPFHKRMTAGLGFTFISTVQIGSLVFHVFAEAV